MNALRASLRPLMALVIVATAASARPAQAQELDPSRRPSPIGIAKTFLGDTYVKVTYGRPYMRGRAIFGDPSEGQEYLVPFGRTWRTGANEATEITVTGPVRMAGQPLPAGTYSLFTVPGADAWEVRIHPGLGMDGTGRLGADGAFQETYDPALDIVVARVAAGTTTEAVEQFTIEFEPVASGAHMVLRWERTEVRVPVEAGG
ncbi:MAG TPA: DUF2911 domain-containing protein [Longimicrobiales bacterium]|nr:DUF2911 domain-containing protein [Longimicrobiales bacterium]